MIGYNQRRVRGICRKQAFLKGLMLLSTLHVPVVIYAAKPSEQYHTLKENLSQLFVPKRALLHKPICKGFFSDIIF
ncbi:hypothetical protein, partial [Acinetobacter baumannii]|uniref:hypothetical protein n=1 Tax=Acinetobacter baumannii TaxID=470 RepID=UPI0009A65E6E